MLAGARSELMKQECKVDTLSTCIRELQRETYSQRLELEDAHCGREESRREQSSSTGRIGHQRESTSRYSYGETVLCTEMMGKMDGERLENQVVTMDKGRKEKLEMEEHVLMPKIVHITRQDLEWFGFRARCPVWMSMHSDGTTRSHRTCQTRVLLHAISHRRRDDFFSSMPHLEVKMMHTLQESAQEDENKDQLW